MASELFGQRFRRAVGDTDSSKFTNADIDDYGLQADEDYPSASFNAKVAYAVYLGFSQKAAEFAELVTYSENASSENASQISDHYSALADKWKARFEMMLKNARVAAAWGSTVVQPKRDEEFPDDTILAN